MTGKQKLIQRLSWAYQYANPDDDVQTALRVLKQPEPSAVTRTKAKHILWDSETNLVKEYQLANKYRYTKAHELLSYLLTHVRVMQGAVSLRLYSGIITFKNLTSDEISPHYFRLLKAIENKLKDYLAGDYSDRSKGQTRLNRNALMLVTAIEDTFFKGMRDGRKDIHNLHDHIIFALMNSKLDVPSDKYTVWDTVTDYLNKFFDIDITVSIRPLINHATNDVVVIDKNTKDSDLNTVFYTALYDLKQRKLPLPHKFSGVSDVLAFKHYEKRTEAITALLNAIPKGLRLHTVLNFKSREEKDNHKLLAIIMDTLTLSNVNIRSLLGVPEFVSRIHEEDVLPFRFSKNKAPP